jgi:hypothetical protein
MTRWSAITRTRGRRSALAYGSRSTTAAEDNLNRLVHHERGRYYLQTAVLAEAEVVQLRDAAVTRVTDRHRRRTRGRIWLSD